MEVPGRFSIEAHIFVDIAFCILQNAERFEKRVGAALNSNEFAQLLIRFHGVRQHDIERRNHVLRKAELLPVGGRGRNAFQIGAREAATMLIGLAGAENAVDSAAAVKRIRDFELRSGKARCGKIFGEALERILSTDGGFAVQEIRICRNLPIADIFYRAGPKNRTDALIQDRYFDPKIGDSSSPLSFGSGAFRIDGVLGGGLLQEIPLRLFDDGEGARVD